MCDLKVANECHAAIEPYIERFAQKYPGQYLVGYPDQARIRVKVLPTYEEAEAFRESLHEDQRAGSIVVSLPKSGVILML